MIRINTRSVIGVAFCMAIAAPVDAKRNKGAVAISDPQCDSEEICRQQGAFSLPFEEPLVTGEFPDQDNTTLTNPLNEYPDNGKCETNEDGVLKCKPAAGSVALLNDGRLLYFNALEGTENVEFSIFFEAGHAIVNDQTRVLSLEKGRANWIAPGNSDGGANPDGYDSTTLLGDTATIDTADSRDNNDGALFCADVVGLADGRIMAVGGTDYYHEPGIDSELLGQSVNFGVSELEGLRNSRVFDPETNAWSKTGDMAHGRWYPSAITLPDGDVLVASGVTKLIKPIYPNDPETSGRNVTQTETYDLACGKWQENGPLAERSLPLYPRLHLLPNGHVLYNAAGQAFNPFGQSYDQALWNIVAAYDPQDGIWSDLAYAGLPLRINKTGADTLTSVLNPTNTEAQQSLETSLAGAMGQLVEDPASLLVDTVADPTTLANAEALIGAGFRGSTFSIMLPLQPDANGQYNRVELLTAGGVLGGVALTSPGGHVGTALSRIDTIDIDNYGMAYESRITGQLTQGRWYGTGVLLPTGEVLVLSGADRDEVQFPGGATPILEAEIFDPATETFRKVATQNRPRTYHNSALLLPDGRVLIGGHAPINTAYSYSVTLPGFSPNDGRDPSFEIYSPPYMFGDRPMIKRANAQAAYGQSFEISLDSRSSLNEKIESVVLVRKTDLTHLVDSDQRTVVLPILEQDGKKINVEITSNRSVLPPGNYMLFVNARNEAGDLVPSESVPVHIADQQGECSL